jgi:hypothetical protein
MRAAGRPTLAAVAEAILITIVPGCGSGSGTQLPLPAIVSTMPADAATGVHLSAAISHL